MSTIIEVPTGQQLANKHLLSDELWKRLVKRIEKDEGIELPMAERIMDQALGFLRLVALDSGKGYAPSARVDIGWHTFVLYTRSYAEFCDRIAGQFIHHEPSDEEGVDYGTEHIARTVKSMLSFGIPVDLEIWMSDGEGGDGGEGGPYCKPGCGPYCRDSSS